MSTVTEFFTSGLFLVTQQSVGQEPVLRNEMLMRVMQSAIGWTQQASPFERIGYVFLPEQIVLLLRPKSTVALDRIMGNIRRRFQVEYDELLNMHDATLLWQEHYETKRVQDVEALAACLDYAHREPVRRGYVERPEAWPYSSFALWRTRGIYPERWGWITEGGKE